MPHELFLTTKQKTKMRIDLSKNMSADIKVSKAQLSKPLNQVDLFGKSLGNMIDKSGK